MARFPDLPCLLPALKRAIQRGHGFGDAGFPVRLHRLLLRLGPVVPPPP